MDMETEPLNASDRCDARNCDAQAFVRTNMLTGCIVLCGHHYNANELALAPVAITVEDFRDALLNVKPSLSANA